jgi:hypothetical protein
MTASAQAKRVTLEPPLADECDIVASFELLLKVAKNEVGEGMQLPTFAHCALCPRCERRLANVTRYERVHWYT